MQSEDITGSDLSGHHCEVRARRIGKCREGAYRPPGSKIWSLRPFGAVVISQQLRQPVAILEIHIGPTGGKLRSHAIVSNYLSEKEWNEDCQMFVMTENAWRMGRQLPNPIFIALCKRQ